MSRRTFVALRHRNFRLLWIGLFVSMTGSLMQNAAILWHVSLLAAPGRKALALGMVGLVRVVPVICSDVDQRGGCRRLEPPQADAHDAVRRRRCGRDACSPDLSWPDAGLADVLARRSGGGCRRIRSAGAPVTDSDARTREDLPNAISLNSIMFQTASVIGPSFAGVLIGTSSLTSVYVANAVSFIFVIGALLMMRGYLKPGCQRRKERDLFPSGGRRSSLCLQLGCH